MANSIKIKVNGLTHGVTASLDTPLLYVLHNELHLHGPRFGCGLAQCGACSVLLDGKEIRSCVTPVAAVSGKSITTLEGLPALWAVAARHDGCSAGAASAAAGVDRRAGAALRLLPERHDDPGRRPARDDEEPVRGPDPHGDERPPLPLRDLSEDPDRDPEGRGRDGEGRCMMTGLMPEKEFSRKTFVKGGGALIVGFSTLGAVVAGSAKAAADPGLREQRSVRPDADRLVDRDPRRQHRNGASSGWSSSARARPTGLLMIAAEELNMDFDADEDALGRHRRDPEPGRDVRQQGAPGRRQQTRAASAAAYQALLGMASTQPRRAGRKPHREQGRRLGWRQDA